MPHRTSRRLITTFAFALIGAASATSDAAESASQAGLRLAWSTTVPMRFTSEIHGWHLVDDNIYAMGSDGLIRVVRAATGELAWMRKFNTDFVKLPGPRPFRKGATRGVVFTNIANLVFLNPATGEELPGYERIHLRHPATGSAATSGDQIFVAEPGERVRAYDMKTMLDDWVVRTNAILRISPVFLPRSEQVLVAADGGIVASLDSLSGSQRFGTKVEGSPIGSMAVDEEEVYVSTDQARLYGLSLTTGERLLEYRLPDRPRGGPVVTATSVYQSLEPAGMQRVGIKPGWPNWFAPDATMFLAEWAERVAYLNKGGELIIARVQTGEPVSTVSIESAQGGIANPHNHAIFVTNMRGEIRCYQPVDLPRLTSEDFVPAPIIRENTPMGDEEGDVDAQPEDESAPLNLDDQDEKAAPKAEINDPLRSNRQ